MTKIIAAICVWNEQSFIEICILNIINSIKDIHAIEIMDGAWSPFAFDYPNSTDQTQDIVFRLREEFKDRCKIVWREPIGMTFESESSKRNRQLQIIEEQYQDYAVLVLDADETIHSATGQQIFELASYAKMHEIGCVKAFAQGSKIPGWTPRLFPGGKKIHYHTKRTMEVDGPECSPKIPYDVESQKSWTIKPGMFEINDFFLVNRYVNRDIDRRIAKLQSRKYEALIMPSVCDYE